MTGDGPISMYVPARNAERTLDACVQSILAQTRRPDELFIVVDPRSSDDTVGVARATGVRVIAQRGPTLGAARNEAILAARFPRIASCDSDVILEPDWLEHLAAHGEPNSAGVGGRTVERERHPCDAWRAIHMPHHWGEHPFRNPFMLVSEVMFDRDALLAVGGYRDDLNYYEDSDLCQRLRDAGYDLYYEPAAVATHQRTDDLHGLLTLRWKYSEYRQKPLMDRFAGLLRKVEVNREYATNTLAKLLARGREELSYISFLLYFHHLVLDLRSFLSRRPLVEEPTRRALECRLAAGAARGVNDWDERLGRQVADDLRRLAPGADGRDVLNPGLLPPAWGSYLSSVRTAVQAFCAELTSPVLAAIAGSAGYVHGRADREDVARLPGPSASVLQSALDRMPLGRVVDHTFIQTIRQAWPDATACVPIGRLNEEEHEALEHMTPCQESAPAGRRRHTSAAGGPEPRSRRPGQVVAVAGHLEASAEPLAVFEHVEPGVGRLVACYQPPGRFVPGLDVISAAELASAASAAGWTIERFDTLVGRTRLLLSRTRARPVAEIRAPVAAGSALE